MNKHRQTRTKTGININIKIQAKNISSYFLK